MGKFPYSIIGTGKDLFVEFVSSAAGPLLNTGFHFNVGNWPGHVDTASTKNGSCDWILSSESLQAKDEGIFLSVAHWYPPGTSCTYLLKGRAGEVARLYFPSFRVNRIESPIQPYDGDCAESLTLYDASWADDARIIKTFCDTFSRPMEKHDFVSTSNSLFVRFESKTGSYSGSSLYYWAHYDFFNATRFGEAVVGTECDETFSSWRQPRIGSLRSPLNTLLYKRPGDPPRDLLCTYTFVTDRRLYARVILTLHSVNFKEHPYGGGASCAHNCWEGRGDRVTLREPPDPAAPAAAQPSRPAHCRCRLERGKEPPIQLLSRGERLELQMRVDGAHAASAYFKQPAALFEASYEFVHGPLCGPAVIEAQTDGELEFPHYEALGYLSIAAAAGGGGSGRPASASLVKCIWELRVSPERDLWLQFVKTKFASRSCEDGKLEVHLPVEGGGFAAEPFLAVCGENVSYVSNMPILSASQVAAREPGQPAAVAIHFVGSMALARAEFKIAWTELYHLPRDAHGNLAHQRLEDCAFECPGGAGCIPERLLCNGVVNCPRPAANSTSSGAATQQPDDESAQTCARFRSPAEPGAKPSPDEGTARTLGDLVGTSNFGGAGLGVALAALLAFTFCVICICRFCCCRKRTSSRNIHVSY